MQFKGWRRELGKGEKTEETEYSTLHLCYCGNVNTEIVISMYCECQCQSVEIEEYTTFLAFYPLLPDSQLVLHQTWLHGAP